ncbi:MAG: hypothetical protein HKN82_06155 [Akkermansiaceae bacterium]|nr:hypothetical protein [Akkermansiaceae bacterium]NNM30274.1 hypothetical protein [Akkermansiaceae bacterium]
MNEPHSHWTKVSAALRDAGVNDPLPPEDLTPPPGFATRVVARSRRADPGLVIWRRLSLLGAGTAAAVLMLALLAFPAPDRGAQFLPVPTLEFPADPTE